LPEIPLARPTFDQAEELAIARVLASCWVSQGPEVSRFEQLFAERTGARYAVATSSCTTALHLAVVLAGIGPGDEVICPSYSFIATANVVLYAGAVPVFAEIEATTWNIDSTDVRRKLTDQTKAVIVVHQFGLAADISAFEELTARGITVIEDAACAVGARFRGRPVGGRGHLTCFSFHPRKTITTGEGGMLTTNDETLATRARQLRSFGASVSDYDRHQAAGGVLESYDSLGYNYRMTDVQAAMGIEQLRKLDRLLEARRAIAVRYADAFRAVPWLQLPADPPDAPHTYQTYGVRLLGDRSRRRDEILNGLIARGISCRRGIFPIHMEPFYRRRLGEITLPVTQDVSASTILLPIFPGLSEQDQRTIIDAVMELTAEA